jgi:hypothetical protein
MPAIMLDDEDAHQKCAVQHRQRQRQPWADGQRHPCKRPKRQKRHKGRGQFKQAAMCRWLAVAGQSAKPGTRSAGGQCVVEHQSLSVEAGIIRRVSPCLGRKPQRGRPIPAPKDYAVSRSISTRLIRSFGSDRTIPCQFNPSDSADAGMLASFRSHTPQIAGYGHVSRGAAFLAGAGCA